MRGHWRVRGNSIELRVFVGRDPITGKQRYRTKTIPKVGKRQAEEALAAFLLQHGSAFDQRRDLRRAGRTVVPGCFLVEELVAQDDPRDPAHHRHQAVAIARRPPRPTPDRVPRRLLRCPPGPRRKVRARPRRRPSSTSACCSQPRNGSAPMPTSRATRVTSPNRWPPCLAIRSCTMPSPLA